MVVTIDVDEVVDVDGCSVEIAAVGGIVKVVVNPPEPVEVQALRTSNAAIATPTRNGGRVSPPKQIDMSMDSLVAPKSRQPLQPYASKESRAPWFSHRESSHHPSKGRPSTADATTLSSRCQQPSNRQQADLDGIEQHRTSRRSRRTLSAECQQPFQKPSSSVAGIGLRRGKRR